MALVVFSALLGMAGVLAANDPASASGAVTSLRGWMLAQGEAQTFASYYGKPIPVQWVTCAKYPTGNPSSCGKRIKIDGTYFTDLIRETAYDALRNEIKAGYIKPGDGVLADYETWSQTPASQQKHPELYICKTDQLAAEHHLFLVQSPFNPSIGTRVKEEVAAASCAAQYGANEVTELQYQGREVKPAAYRSFIAEAVSAIHAKARHARIIGGLATDLKGKAVPIRDVYCSYKDTTSMLIGYWLNSSTHTQNAIKFFEEIGAITPRLKPPSC